MNSVLETIAERGTYIDVNGEKTNEIRELLCQGLIVRVSDIPHHPHTLNPSYTYVTNDEKGMKRAIDEPLFTAVCGLA